MASTAKLNHRGGSSRRRQFDLTMVDPIFLAPLPESGEQSQRLWHLYWSRQDPASLDALIRFYAPVVRVQAVKLKRGRPEFYTDPVDDMLADGLRGLLNSIRAQPSAGCTTFLRDLNRAIRCAILRCHLVRHYRGRRQYARDRIIAQARATFICETGLQPTEAELAERLGIVNPQIQVGDESPRMHRHADQPRRVLRIIADRADDRMASPPKRVIDAETTRLARKLFKGEDAKIFRMVLAGHGPKAIAEQLGLSRTEAGRRVNGVLWTARCRRELADYVGVEPCTMPPRKRDLPAISSMPPARLAG